VRIAQAPFAVLMRTPGDDAELVAGFLFSEHVISSCEDLGAIDPCTDPDHPEARNVVNVTLAAEAARALDRVLAARRKVVINSSCGLCGRLTLDAVHVTAAHVDSPLISDRALISSLPQALRERQTLFTETGGLHAAGLFEPGGLCVSSFEDVGRHNALDKLVGRALLDDDLPLSDRVLAVSGRASYEIVQKAFLAGIPIVAAVSAPSSLAIRLADAAGITLIGFVRDGGFNVYAHPERVRS
jgi:FdhD protein